MSDLYEILSARFLPVIKCLDLERQTELDGAIADAARWLDCRIDELLQDLACKCCSFCSGNVPRVTVNNQEVHVVALTSNPMGVGAIETGVYVTCKASPFWSTHDTKSAPICKPQGSSSKNPQL